MIPESPKWLYTWKNFDKSREVLNFVARFNGVHEEVIKNEIENAKFIDEDEGEQSQGRSSVATSLSGTMSTGTYVKNMIVQATLWSVISFTYYVLSFMTKYYEGGIYLNYYLDGSSGLIGVLLALPFYRWLKMRLSFLIALSTIFVGLIFVMLFQENYIYPGWITCFGLEPSPYPEGSKKDLDYYNKFLVPGLIFVIKLWNQAAFVFVYQTSFNEDLIFPFYKRISSCGVCNFIGRLVTVAAPIVAELDRPLPVILLLSANVLALIAAIFLPSKEAVLEYT